jgi:hypothetical protein
MNTKSMSIGEVRNLLVEYGLSTEEAETLSPKSVAVAKLMEFVQDDEVLENIETATETVVEQEEEKRRGPQDPDWTEYVMSLLRPNELSDGAPKVDGLRRLVELLIGTIECLQTTVLQCPTPENQNHCTVKVRVVAGNQITDGTADAYPGNTPAMFSKHIVATCESRAEARAYRRLLRLSNVIAAEELVKDEEIFDPAEQIQSHQLLFIDNQCKKLNIDVKKWLESKNIKITSIDKISRSKATELLGDLNAMMVTGVNDNIKGYVEMWRISA